MPHPINPLFSTPEKVFFGASIAALLTITSVVCVSLFTKNPYLLGHSFPLRKKSSVILGGSGLVLLSGLCGGALSLKVTRARASEKKRLGPLLIQKIFDGDTEAAKQLLRDGAEPNSLDQNGFSALQIATYEENTDLVHALLRAGADPNAQASYRAGYKTALIYAVEKGRLDIVNALLEQKANPNLQDITKGTALMYAAERGDTEIVDALLKKRADPDIYNSRHRTALMYAVEKGHTEAVKALLQTNADPDVLSWRNESALILASRKKHLGIVQVLIEHGVQLDVQDDNLKYTALMYAARQGTLTIIEALLKARATLDAVDIRGNTALMLAAHAGHVGIVKALLKAGTNPDLVNKHGQTAEILHNQQQIRLHTDGALPLFSELVEAENERAVAELYALICPVRAGPLYEVSQNSVAAKEN